jgi:hypothetical protein
MVFNCRGWASAFLINNPEVIQALNRMGVKILRMALILVAGIAMIYQIL